MFSFYYIAQSKDEMTAKITKNDKGKELEYGFVGVQDGVFYINAYKDMKFSGKDVMLLLSQLLQGDESILNNPIEINIIE